jgi:UPF0716 protein FxsA
VLRRWLTGFAVVLVVGAVAELVLLGVVVWLIGLAWTLGLLIVKSVVGYLLAQRVGRRGWRQFRATLDSGHPPGRDGTDAAVAFGGAMLVLLAGFIGAVAGLVLLIPPVRRAATRLAERVVERQLTAAAANGVFGPRPVRVRRDKPAPGPASPDPRAASASGEPPPVIEGEILPPR